MPVKTASVPIGATFTPSGGIATSLKVLGSNLDSVQSFVATTGVTQLTRTEVSFSVKQPRVNTASPGGFTQSRSKIRIDTPKVLSNSARTKNSIIVELSVDPETTAVEVEALKTLAINVITDADFADFWLNQSTD